MNVTFGFNLYPIYEEGVGNKTALGTTLSYITETNQKLADRGFTFGEASVYPPYRPSTPAVLLTMAGAVSMFVFMVNLFIPMRRNKQLAAALALMLVSFVLYLVTGGTLITQIWALSTAICAPVNAIILIMNCWVRRATHRNDRVRGLLPAKPSFTSLALPCWPLLAVCTL